MTSRSRSSNRGGSGSNNSSTSTTSDNNNGNDTSEPDLRSLLRNPSHRCARAFTNPADLSRPWLWGRSNAGRHPRRDSWGWRCVQVSRFSTCGWCLMEFALRTVFLGKACLWGPKEFRSGLHISHPACPPASADDQSLSICVCVSATPSRRNWHGCNKVMSP